MGDRIDDVIEEITVDAYGEHEQLWSFRQVFEDEARLPLRGRVVGAEVKVKVLSVDFDGNERRGLIALCQRGDEVHTVSLLEVTPDGPLPLRTRQLFDAYRRWSGATPLGPVEQDQATPWAYPRFASVAIEESPPLALEPMGDWDPTEEYWGEPDQSLDPEQRQSDRYGPQRTSANEVDTSEETHDACTSSSDRLTVGSTMGWRAPVTTRRHPRTAPSTPATSAR